MEALAHPFRRRVQIQEGRIAFAAMNHRFEERQFGDNELPFFELSKMGLRLL